MGLFKSKPKSCAGIDIGTSSIKVVQLKRSEGRYKLETYGELQTHSYLERLNEPFKAKSLKMLESQVIEMIKKVIKEADISTRNIALSVPVFSSFVAVVDMPPMAEKELSEAISFESKRHIPIPSSEVKVDWKVIDKSKVDFSREGKKKLFKFRVLLVAVPNEVISRYLRIVQALKLNLVTLELESFSCVRSLMGEDKSAACILDLGARSTSFTIVDNGFIQASHSVDTAGTELTRALSHGVGVGFERAETYKKQQGLGQENMVGKEAKEILLTLIDKIIMEVERAIKNYESKTKRGVSKLILSGGSANLAGLKDYLETKMKVDIIPANPWARVSYHPLLEPTLKEIAPGLAVAVGLAMSGV